MYLHIFKTLSFGIEQSCEAKNNLVVLHLSRRFILQGFIFITHPFLKVIKCQDPHFAPIDWVSVLVTAVSHLTYIKE